MAAKKGFSERAWEEIINGDPTGRWFDATIDEARKSPDTPFADVGPVVEAMLAAGVTKDQLVRLARAIRYGAVFETVMLAAELGLDAEQLDGIHEELLSADPSGMEGRPGSWPVKAASKVTQRGSKAKAAGRGADPSPLTLPKAFTFVFSPDSSRLWLGQTSITATTIRGVDLPSGKPFAEFDSLPNLRRLACSPDAKRLAVSNHDGAVAVHEGASGRELWKSPKTGEEARDLLYTPDGKTLISSGSESVIRRRDTASGKEMASLDFGDGWLADEMLLSPDDKTLAVIAVKIPGAGHVSYWDVEKGIERGRHRVPGQVPGLVGFTPDGKQLILSTFEHVIAWETKSNKPKKLFPVEELRNANLHPSGKLIACQTFQGCEIREFPSGKLLKKLDTKKLYPSGWAFSPDGHYVLLVSNKQTQLWRTESLIG